MSFKTYENYKDSRVEWIGEIPLDWKLVRNKNLFRKSKVIVGPQWVKFPVLSLTKKGVIIKDIESNEGKMPSDFSVYQIINPGNLLLCLFDIDVTPRCVGFIENKGIVSSAYSEIKSISNISMKYYYYWYLMLDIDKRLLHLSKNLRNSLSNEDFMALPIVKPSLKEQISIANFLDKKLQKIDENISKNKELISLLEEKKVTLINQIVTKGLDLNVPMKDSGIEWIGQIPTHWECRKINTLASVRRGASPRPIDDPKYFDDDGTYSWVRISDVTSSEKYLEKTEQKLSSLGKSLSVPMEPGNIFVSIAATVGKPIITNIKCCIHDGFVYFKNLELYEGYLFYIFEGKESYKGLGKLGTQLNLNTETIGRIYVPVPPEEEQKKIEKFLDYEINKINKIINKTQENIELLEEYKDSLIYHVVTGKIDVRDEV